jgi:hypothetical protein
MRTVYVLKDLGIEIYSSEVTSSLRPQWAVNFPIGFQFKHQVQIEGKIIEEKAMLRGSFFIEHIVHEINSKGDFQKIYLSPRGWELKWGD